MNSPCDIPVRRVSKYWPGPQKTSGRRYLLSGGTLLRAAEQGQVAQQRGAAARQTHPYRADRAATLQPVRPVATWRQAGRQQHRHSDRRTRVHHTDRAAGQHLFTAQRTPSPESGQTRINVISNYGQGKTDSYHGTSIKPTCNNNINETEIDTQHKKKQRKKK